MSDRLRGRQDDYRRALADPVRFDVAFYAGLYIEELEAEVERLAAERDRETRGARAVHNLALAILERHQNGTAADRRDLKSILELTLAAVSAEKEEA